jgi:protein TonB
VPPFQVENGIADTENIRVQDGDSGADSRNPDSGHEIKTPQKASPLYRVNPPPFYPRTARALGLEGTVELNVLVDVGGRVRDLKLFKSSGHKMLDRAAMESVKNWLFEPGKKGSHPVDMWVVVPMVFKLAQA